VKKEFNNAAFYHLEIFIALPGKLDELYREREMENAYQTGIGRPAPMIFVRDQGAAWDMFSLGCYRDLKHWAGTGDIPKERRGGPTSRIPGLRRHRTHHANAHRHARGHDGRRNQVGGARFRNRAGNTHASSGSASRIQPGTA
jgi:hypothetical protein